MTAIPPDVLMQEAWKFFQPIWRILLVVLIAQIIGMAFGVLSNYFGHLFLNIWYGGVYASPVGFILGLLWHIQAVPNGYSRDRLVIILVGFVAILLPLFGFFTYDIWRLNLTH